MKAMLFGLALGAAALAGASPAQAVKVYVTYEGIVTSESDNTGLFGGGAFAGGTRYTASYVFDVAYDGTHQTEIQSDTSNQIRGGTRFGNVSPLLGATLTIGAFAHTLSGAYDSSITGYIEGAYSEQAHRATGTGPDEYMNHIISTYDGSNGEALPAQIVHALFERDLPPNDESFGVFCVDAGCIGLAPDVLRITTQDQNAVPLPAALPLFAAGVGVVALVARKKKRALNAAA